MQIELFMANFSHDRAEGERADRPGGWLHGGMSKPTSFASLTEALGTAGGSIPNIFLRKEEWGGLVFNKIDRAIYEVDQDGFQVLSRLQNGESVEQIRSSGDVASAELDSFVEAVRGYTLLS